MCAPSTVAEALAALRASLAFLNQVAAADLPGAVQADCLRELAKAESGYTAAHARMLGAFAASGAHEDDGQQSERAWLKWQTQITKGAAAGAVGWMKRLAAHPAVSAALANGAVSPSWARHICTWTDELPEDGRDDADQILLAAAAGGAVLPDLAALAEEMRRRTAAPDPPGPDGGFDERRLRLGLTFGGAGVLEGDLTPACAAALAAVLEALGKKAGPEDVRTAPQRRHDALEEACRRLIGTGGLPDRAGQPTQIQLHLTLDQLRDLPGADEAEAAWRAAAAARAAAEGQPGWLTGRAAQAYACDAAITPIVTATVDQAALAALTAEIRAATPTRGPQEPPTPAALARLHETLLRRAADFCPGRVGWPRSCASASPASRPPQPACRWTPAPLPASSRARCAERSSPATGTARSRAATSHRTPARCTTSKNAPTVARPASPTWSCSARSTTSSPYTNGAGPSPCTPMARSPRSARTAPAACTATAHPAAPPSRLALCLLRPGRSARSTLLAGR